MHVCVSACVCVRERVRVCETDRQTDRDRASEVKYFRVFRVGCGFRKLRLVQANLSPLVRIPVPSHRSFHPNQLESRGSKS